MTPNGKGLIEFIANGGDASSCTTDATGYAIGSKIILLANAGTGFLKAGKRIKFLNDDNFYTLKYSVSDVSGAGLATGSTTDATGYAIGATVITLAAGGTGSVQTGNIVTVAGDTTQYTASLGNSDVSTGGSITITPALTQAIPASATAITVNNAATIEIGLLNAIPAATTAIYTGGELKRGWGHDGYLDYSGVFTSQLSDNVFLDWYDSGQIARLWLDQGYTNLDLKHDDVINRSIATSGVSQTRVLRQTETPTFSIDYVSDQRTSVNVSDYEAFESMFETFAKGGLMAWFPDYLNNPTEFFWCTMEKRDDPKRKNGMHWHGFKFNLRIEAGTAVSIPSFG